MKPEEIKPNLNKKVRYKNSHAGIDAEYILSGALFRRNEKGFYYQAELQDLKNNKSILICNIEDVEVLQ